MSKEANKTQRALSLALEALTATMATHGFREHIEEAQDKAIKALEEALATQEHDCTRSHPHEEMSKECELRTEIARLTNQLANTKQEQGEQDTLAYREAASLAQWLFNKHFAREEHYASGRVVWGLCDTTAGVISQIDNMVCKLVREQEQGSTTCDKPVAWGMKGKDGFIFDVICPAEHEREEGGYTTPLYTTPPSMKCEGPQQRTWVGLTEEDEVLYPYPPAKPPVYATSKNTKSVRDGYELGGYEKEAGYYSEKQLDEFALAVEAKLKEKNT